MAFRKFKGKTKFIYVPVTVSTAFSNGALVSIGAAGTLIEAVDNERNSLGVIRHAIASTDADYATARMVEVEVPVEKHVVWEADATAATFVAADIGDEFGISSALLVDRTDVTNRVFKVLEVVSTSVIRGFLKLGGQNGGSY